MMIVVRHSEPALLRIFKRKLSIFGSEKWIWRPLPWHMKHVCVIMGLIRILSFIRILHVISVQRSLCWLKRAGSLMKLESSSFPSILLLVVMDLNWNHVDFIIRCVLETMKSRPDFGWFLRPRSRCITGSLCAGFVPCFICPTKELIRVCEHLIRSKNNFVICSCMFLRPIDSVVATLTGVINSNYEI